MQAHEICNALVEEVKGRISRVELAPQVGLSPWAYS